MRLWHIECIVQDTKHYELMQYLEKIKAYNVVSKTFKNGADEEQPKKKKKEGRKHNNDLPTQTDWLQKHLKDDMTSGDIRDAFVEAGYPGVQLYGALSRLVKMNKAKKLASGKYKLIGGA